MLENVLFKCKRGCCVVIWGWFGWSGGTAGHTAPVPPPCCFSWWNDGGFCWYGVLLTGCRFWGCRPCPCGPLPCLLHGGGRCGRRLRCDGSKCRNVLWICLPLFKQTLLPLSAKKINVRTSPFICCLLCFFSAFYIPISSVFCEWHQSLYFNCYMYLALMRQ